MAVDEITAEVEERADVIEAGQIQEAFVPVPVPDLVEREVDGDLVLIDEAGGKLQHLDQIGAIVWTLFDGVSSISDTASELSRVFGADPEVVRSDVLTLAQQLGRAGLLVGVVPERIQMPSMPAGRDVGTELTLPALPTLDGSTFDLSSLRGRRYVLVNWSPACGFCVGIAEQLVDLYAKLRENDLDMVLLCASTPERNAELAEKHKFPFVSILRTEDLDVDDDPFPSMGTPSAYLIDEAGSIAQPARIGALDVPALIRELVGLEDAPHDHGDHAEDEGGPRYLPIGGGACAPGATVVEYATTTSFLVGDWYVGVKSKTVEGDEILRALLRDHLAEDAGAQGNFAVTLESGQNGSMRAVNLLTRGSEVLVRSGNPGRVLFGLVQYLSTLIELPAPDGLLYTSHLALIGGDGKAIMVPKIIRDMSKKAQPYLHRAGLRFADVPAVGIDLAAGEVVVPEPLLSYDAAVLASLDMPATSSEPSRVLPGRYSIKGWAPAMAMEGSPPLSRGRAVALIMAASDTTALGIDGTLDGLTDLFGSVRVHTLPAMTKEKDLAKAIVAAYKG